MTVRCADNHLVTLRARDAPSAVISLAMALSRGERRELLQVAQFVRGLAIQITYRLVTGEMLAEPGRATLLFSRLDRPRPHPVRLLLAVLAATVVGLILFLVSNALLLLPLSLILHAVGAGPDVIGWVALGIAAVRLTWTASRAVKTYRLERRREKAMVAVGGRPRWRLDLMGSTPPGAGHGSRLLREFVRQSDAAGATVYLVTEPHNRPFYRRAGFHAITSEGMPAFEGMVFMRRVAPTPKIPRQQVSATAQPASLPAEAPSRS